MSNQAKSGFTAVGLSVLGQTLIVLFISLYRGSIGTMLKAITVSDYDFICMVGTDIFGKFKRLHIFIKYSRQ
jgi:hypothetical protein